MSKKIIKIISSQIAKLKPLKPLAKLGGKLFLEVKIKKMLSPKELTAFYAKIEAICKEKGYLPGKSGRHMKYPYTMSAKIAQFPLFFYLKNMFLWTYYPLGLIGCFYFFLKINRAVNSEENKRSWAETQRKAAEKEHH